MGRHIHINLKCSSPQLRPVSTWQGGTVNFHAADHTHAKVGVNSMKRGDSFVLYIFLTLLFQIGPCLFSFWSLGEGLFEKVNNLFKLLWVRQTDDLLAVWFKDQCIGLVAFNLELLHETGPAISRI